MRADNRFLDEWVVEESLGEGGFGTVHRVRHLRTDNVLALKTARFKDAQHRTAFVTEIVAWMGLPKHEQLAMCWFVRSLDDDPKQSRLSRSVLGVFSEYVAGGTLGDWIREGRCKRLDCALDIAIQVAWGLHVAHSRGVVHQDVKPANILMTPAGVAKLTDFGLARVRARDGKADSNVTFAGLTPAYCSPEQACANQVSYRTDIWSWAVSVMELCLGDVTWSAGQVAHEALEECLGDPSSAPSIPPSLAPILRRALRPMPEERWSSMAEVVDELRAAYRDSIGEDYERALREPPRDPEDHYASELEPPTTALDLVEADIRVALLRMLGAARTPRAKVIACLAACNELLEQLAASGDDREFAMASAETELVRAKSFLFLGDSRGALPAFYAAEQVLAPWVASGDAGATVVLLDVVQETKRGEREYYGRIDPRHFKDTVPQRFTLATCVPEIDRTARYYSALGKLRLVRAEQWHIEPRQALRDVKRAIELFKLRQSRWPTPIGQSELATARLIKARTLRALGKPKSAIAACETAQEVCAAAVCGEYTRGLEVRVLALLTKSEILEESGNVSAAGSACDDALEQVALSDPELRALVLERLARLDESAGDTQSALARVADAVASLRVLVEFGDTRSIGALCRMLVLHARILSKNDEWEKTKDVLTHALDLLHREMVLTGGSTGEAQEAVALYADAHERLGLPIPKTVFREIHPTITSPLLRWAELIEQKAGSQLAQPSSQTAPAPIPRSIVIMACIAVVLLILLALFSRPQSKDRSVTPVATTIPSTRPSAARVDAEPLFAARVVTHGECRLLISDPLGTREVALARGVGTVISLFPASRVTLRSSCNGPEASMTPDAACREVTITGVTGEPPELACRAGVAAD